VRCRARSFPANERSKRPRDKWRRCCRSARQPRPNVCVPSSSRKIQAQGFCGFAIDHELEL
jgi:hypothetical protein